eukprot:gb/GFBE01077246.1/.p1 GENE.gb/GFBE01077246.1/~~gb/GFBE01077246.1/.p1  ORF type:complete len:310 (+),score=63.89 gb/GFBE01077246.1/:1-930(+)
MTMKEETSECKSGEFAKPVVAVVSVIFIALVLLGWPCVQKHEQQQVCGILVVLFLCSLASWLFAAASSPSKAMLRCATVVAALYMRQISMAWCFSWQLWFGAILLALMGQGILLHLLIGADPVQTALNLALIGVMAGIAFGSVDLEAGGRRELSEVDESLVTTCLIMAGGGGGVTTLLMLCLLGLNHILTAASSDIQNIDTAELFHQICSLADFKVAVCSEVNCRLCAAQTDESDESHKLVAHRIREFLVGSVRAGDLAGAALPLGSDNAMEAILEQGSSSSREEAANAAKAFADEIHSAEHNFLPGVS